MKTMIIMFIFIIPNFLFAKESNNKKWAITLEAGNGSIFGITSYYRINKFGVGIGAGFDYSNENIDENQYSLFLFSSTINGIYHFLGDDVYQIDGRLKFGYNYLSVNEFSMSGIELTPEILMGYKNIYGIISGVILFADETYFIPQIGVGYRFQF